MPLEFDEHEIFRRLCDGEVSALERLIAQNQNELFRLAYRFLGNREDAEEVVQDTFLRAWRKIDSFRQQASFSTWLYRICINDTFLV